MFFIVLSYLSSYKRCGGVIKQFHEDFVVEELHEAGALSINTFYPLRGTGEFLWVAVQKKGWSIPSLVSRLSSLLSLPFRHISYAGIKDRRAITVQWFSFKGVSWEKLSSLKIKDVWFNGGFYCAEPVRLGSNYGNRFYVRIRGCNVDKARAIWEELGGIFPNYFGEQRFGSTRKNTAKIGLYLLKGDYESAVLSFLCDEGNEGEEVNAVRRELYEQRNFERALREFPSYLVLERRVLSLLARGKEWKHSLRALPRSTLLLFIHAFQSQLFNEALSQRLPEPAMEKGEYFCGENKWGFPDVSKHCARGWLCGKVIGYRSPLNEREKRLLEKYGITQEHFKMRSFPSLASPGTYRPLFAPVRDFRQEGERFYFSLGAGCYATSFLREFLKND